MMALTFRTRILLSLLGCVAILLGLTMVFVHRETARQVDRFENRTTERAAEAFEQLERLWVDRLVAAAGRLSASQRIRVVLLEGAREELTAVTADELVMAAMPDALAVLADPEGAPLMALLDGEPLDTTAVSVQPWLDRLIADEEPAYGYGLVDGRLFVLHATVLALFQRPVGILVLGFPVTDADARRLADVVDAEICFVGADDCAAATPAAREDAMQSLLVATARRGTARTARLGGQRWALLPQEMAPAGAQAAARIVAVPLGPILAPFERIQRVAALAGILGLLLAGLLSSALSRGLTRPVDRLVVATRRVARGEYDVRVPVSSRDEIGTLATAFNSMADGLQLKERYRGVLDKVVSPEVAEELLKGEIRLGGETREVTTLFADLRGFTARTEGMEPQDVVHLLNEFLGRATAAVESEGGVVDKYVGDEVIALFGAPVARPDEPVRAVRAALAIREAVDELNRERASRGEPALEVGIGINTGTAVAGNMGSPRRMNYTVVGESVNLTARLTAAAQPGQILVSEATHDQVRDHVVAHRLPPIRVKGLSYDVQAFAVEAAREGSRQWDAAPAGGRGLLVVAALLIAAASAAAQQPTPRRRRRRSSTACRVASSWRGTCRRTGRSG
jgi:adenylate cyclase